MLLFKYFSKRTYVTVIAVLLLVSLPGLSPQAQDFGDCSGTTTFCQNGGTCVLLEVGQEACFCLPGFSGQLCEQQDTSVCQENEFVSGASCLACPAGTTNQAGDNASGGDTQCDVTSCAVNEYVSGNVCTACEAGTTNEAGDDASGIDTSCAEVIECAGFEPPMGIYPVRVKKNRALPLKAELLDYKGLFTKTDADLTAPPVVQVMLGGISFGDADVSDDALPAGQGSEGNQFVFTDESKWQFNLKTSLFTAPGTYIISMESGDSDVYIFDPQCVAQFEIQ